MMDERKIITAAVIGLIFIVAITNGWTSIQGAVTATTSDVVFELDMETNPEVSSDEVMYEIGSEARLIYDGTNAWHFNGQTNFVQTSSTHLKDIDMSTIMFWFKSSDLTNRKRAHMVWQGEIDEKRNGQYAGDGWGPEQEFHISTGDHVGIQKYEKGVIVFYLGDSKNSIKIKKPFRGSGWHHAALVLDNRDGGYAQLFIDGTSVGRETIYNKISKDKWDTLFLGKAGKDGPTGDSDRYFGGKLNDLTIHHRLYTGPEIKNICYKQSNAKFCK
jgi:hypothetical protein